MDILNEQSFIKLRSHLNKYLIADDDQHTVRQSRNRCSRRAVWQVEQVDGGGGLRLRSCHGLYLTATSSPFLLGMTGEKVVQGKVETRWDPRVEWQPLLDGFQIRLKSALGGKFLRANGGPPPWRSSVTVDMPYTGSTQDWVLWDLEPVDSPPDMDELSCPYPRLSSASSFDSHSSSPMSVIPPLPSSIQQQQQKRSEIMEVFENAKVVRLRSHHDKYLVAEEDEETVTQERSGSSKRARWTVDFVSGGEDTPALRLRSCYGKYLTASNHPFLLGMTGCKVLQTLPLRSDSSLDWIPLRDGSLIKLQTRFGNFLRANGGLPPWRNSVTHDVPHRSSTQDWVLWDFDIVDIVVRYPHDPPPLSPDSVSDDFSTQQSMESVMATPPVVEGGTFSKQQSMESMETARQGRVEGRMIHYHVADENGEVDDENIPGFSITFTGSGVDELTRKLEEETGLSGILVCSRSPLNGKLFPLRLQLPPNNMPMHVVLLLSSSTGR